MWELRVSVADNGVRNGVLFRAPVASCGSASAAWEVRRLPQWGHIAENAGAEACFIPHAAASSAKGAIALRLCELPSVSEAKANKNYGIAIPRVLFERFFA